MPATFLSVFWSHLLRTSPHSSTYPHAASGMAQNRLHARAMLFPRRVCSREFFWPL